MTAAIRDSLAQVVALLDRATPGPWASAHSFRGVYSQHPTPGPVQVCRAPEHFHDTWRGNAEAMVAAVNFLRAHQDEISALLTDAERWRKLVAMPVVVECEELHWKYWHDEPRCKSLAERVDAAPATKEHGPALLAVVEGREDG